MFIDPSFQINVNGAPPPFKVTFSVEPPPAQMFMAVAVACIDKGSVVIVTVSSFEHPEVELVIVTI